jgi:glutaredoxin 2
VRSKLLKARVLSIGLEEFATESAQQYFYKRWNKTPQIIADDLAKTDEYVKVLQPQLQIISDALQSENFVYDKLAMADIDLFPALRSATCVKGLVFPERLNKYMNYHLKQAKVAPLTQI